ncbi:hypothetical protein [Paenibacillus illinoisensis]|uniref:hypothetical protein n=1 Tax=Paenibacillus illinoisensis TaxID=59845 RepID=UPI001C8D4201|nr:hypothetical protein [Paenibacillus illinoisensis]MBY0217781.1 hypothetical protein [Paenibacillus illinoisensis]
MDLKQTISENPVVLGTPIAVESVRFPPIRHSSWHSNASMEADSLNLKLPLPLHLWIFSDSLTKLQRETIQINEETVKIPYEPQLSLKIAVPDPSTKKLDLMEWTQWNYAAKLDLRVKRNAHPTSVGSQLYAYTYEFMGVRESDIVLLERMLQSREELNAAGGVIKLLFPSVKKGELSSGSHNTDIFLMQFNLSSETNPSDTVADFAPQPGNDDVYTFTSKLWKGSITRSGGYYLHYYDREAKTGLPDYLFEDGQDATLTLLYIIPGVPDAQDQTKTFNKLRTYTNCVITGGIQDDALHELASATPMRAKNIYMEVNRKVEDVPYNPNLSLKDYGEIYCTEPAEIAVDNPDLKLAGSIKLRVIDGTYTADAGDPRELSQILTRFGIQEKDLVDLNPHIKSIDDLSEIPLHLPDIEYTPFIGDNIATLASTAAFFGTSVASLAQSNQDRKGLFAADYLKIRTGPVIRSSILPQGVMELTAQRPHPLEPTSEENEDAAYIESLYHMLGFEVQPKGGFIHFEPSLPIGPVEERESWRYSKAIPYTKVAVPDDGRPVTSPYYGIGSFLQLRYRWMDIFGNRLGDSGSLDGTLLSAPIYFTDALLGPRQWPGMAISYVILSSGDVSGTVLLQLQFQFRLPVPDKQKGITDTMKRQARENAKVLKLASEQLSHRIQDGRSELGGSELSVKCHLATSLWPEQRIEVSSKYQEELSQWLSSLAHKLTQWSGNPGNELLPAEDYLMKFKIPVQQINSKDIFELKTEFMLERNLVYVTPRLRSTSEISSSHTVVPAARSEFKDDGDNSHAAEPLLDFANKLEEALLVTGEFKVKAAVGSDRKRWHAASAELPIWLVRIAAKQGEIGLRLNITGRPSIFAPVPLTNIAEAVPFRKTWIETEGIVVVDNSLQVQDIVETINMEWRVRYFLDALDEILSPAYVAAFEQLYKYGEPQNSKTHYINQIRDNKENIAGYISEQLNGVFGMVNDVELEQARKAFRQQLLMELSKAYYTNAIVLYNQANARASLDMSEIVTNGERNQASKLYGEMVTDPKADQSIPQGIVLSRPKVEIHPEGAVMANTTMTYAVSGLKEDPSLKAHNSYISYHAGYLPTHIEHQIAEVEGIPEYKASSWLYFIKPEDAKSSELYQPLSTVKVPLVLRAYPEIPSLKFQTYADASYGQKEYVKPLMNSLRWDYSFAYTRSRHFPQDRLYVKIKFNEQPSMADDTVLDIQDLRTSLEQFNDCYPSVRLALNELVMKWNMEDSPKNWDALHKPFASMSNMTQIISGHWKQWVDQMNKQVPEDLNTEINNVNPKEEYNFYIEERDDETDGQAEWIIHLYELSASPLGITPTISIPGYRTKEPAAELGTNGLRHLKYRFTQEGGQETALVPDIGPTVPKRIISLPGLDILSFRRVKASFHVTRNEYLLPEDKEYKSAEPFIYRTATFEYEKHLLPRLLRNYPIPLDSYADVRASRSLIEHLAGFFQMLFATSTLEEQLQIQLECTYSYRLLNQAFSVSIPVCQMPLRTCVPERDFVNGEDWDPHNFLTDPGEGNQSSFVYNLATAIWKFLDKQNPVRREGRLHLKIELMSEYDLDPVSSELKKRPVNLLQLTDVFLDLDQITDLPETI